MNRTMFLEDFQCLRGGFRGKEGSNGKEYQLENIMECFGSLYGTNGKEF